MARQPYPNLSPGDAVFLWRYDNPPRGYVGWHFTANASGCASMRAILDADVSKGRSRSVALSPPGPAELCVPNCDRPHVAVTRLRLAAIDAPGDLWTIDCRGTIVTVTMGSGAIGRLIRALDDICQGIGDYSLGDDPHRLWIWWRSS